MTSSRFNRQKLNYPHSQRRFPMQKATLLILAGLTAMGAIALSWLAGVEIITQGFADLNALQQTSPWWLEVPAEQHFLIAPTVCLCAIAFITIKFSPQARPWSRVVVVSIVLALTIRYLLWRSLTTLNLSNPLDGFFSLGLLGLEYLLIFPNSIQLFFSLQTRNRQREADQKSVAVVEGNYTPGVDILIPTYNEPAVILRRTVVGCQAVDYERKKVYLLDDSRRPEIRKLAVELGCEYLSRPDNRDAKAGNLNHAIAHTQSELILVFDADFVPTQNFLTRTVGFFQDPEIAMVQTHQGFYNFDPTAHNLGIETEVTHDIEIFSRQNQPIRDGVDSTICSGSSFVVRRSALTEVGGFVTESLSEDYFTGIRLTSKGYQVIYLDEQLSAGLAAENMSALLAQRLRWARGTLQAFFIEANPLTIPGLKLRQRLAHLEGLLHWFTYVARAGLLLAPLGYAFLGLVPVQANLLEFLYFFLPYYAISLIVFGWLNGRSRSAFISDAYSVSLCFPVALTVMHSLIAPFSTGFSVTPKGLRRDRYFYNWAIAAPLIFIFLATLVGLWQSFVQAFITPAAIVQVNQGINLFWLWGFYNLLIIAVSLLSFLEIPASDPYEWFNLRRIIRLSLEAQNFGKSKEFWGITQAISEGGVEVMLTQISDFLDAESLSFHAPAVWIEIMEENLKIPGKITQLNQVENSMSVRVMFEKVTLSQYRQLIRILFCRPGQWLSQETPGEWRSLLLLLQVLLRPRALFKGDRKVRAIAVSQQSETGKRGTRESNKVMGICN